MSGKKEDKERLTDASHAKPHKKYETTKMGVILFITCVAAIVSKMLNLQLSFCNNFFFRFS